MFAIRDEAPVEFTVEALMKAAEAKTGLHEWGDMRFLEGLEALVKSFREEGFAQMSEEVVGYMGPSLVALLVSRLQILDDRKKYPEIAQECITQPIFFIGMARTGSTLIQSLFAQDPANLAAEFWEMMLPSPPPKFGIGAERQARAAQIMKAHLEAAPGFSNQHPYFIEEGYRALAECNSATEWSFSSIQLPAFYPLRSYLNWFLNSDPEEAVKFHRMALQHLQWGRSGRFWVSKAIDWGVYLDQLCHQYPDGKFIWTHRDPLAHVASLASNLQVVRQYGGRPVTDLHSMGDLALDIVSGVFERLMSARDRADSSRFFDSYYEDLVEEPVERVRYMYVNFLGRSLTAEAELRMASWLRDNNQTKHGKHLYEPADFGLSRENVEKRLATYMQRYGERFRRA